MASETKACDDGLHGRCMKDWCTCGCHWIAEHPAETVELLVEAGVLVPFTRFRQRFEKGRIEVMQASEMWMDGEQLYRVTLPTEEPDQ